MILIPYASRISSRGRSCRARMNLPSPEVAPRGSSRLSEDENITVLVLEADGTGDAIVSSIGMYTFSSTCFQQQRRTIIQTSQEMYTTCRSRAHPTISRWFIRGEWDVLYSVRPSHIELDARPALSAPGEKAAIARWG